jgi:Co/Zn/Cd efflux system component
MGVIASLALIANVVVALMLYAFRDGDANMRSVWLCSRNDAMGNIAVMLAAFGVFGTGLGWPDLVVAAILAVLALSSGVSIVRQARLELQDASNEGRETDESKSPFNSLQDRIVL